MLLVLLEKLERILENFKVKLNKNQLHNLAETLIYYNDSIVPAKVIKRELKISYSDTHDLMIFLQIKGILIPKYKIYCENDSITGVSKIYDDPKDIPVEICDRCDRECTLIKNLVVEFKVCI